MSEFYDNSGKGTSIAAEKAAYVIALASEMDSRFKFLEKYLFDSAYPSISTIEANDAASSIEFCSY